MGVEGVKGIKGGGREGGRRRWREWRKAVNICKEEKTTYIIPTNRSKGESLTK